MVPKDMRDRDATRQEVIGDYAPMAAPPDGLCAHDRAAMPLGNITQLLKSGSKRIRRRVIGVCAKGGVSPIGVGRWRRIPWTASPAAERADVAVVDARISQGCGKDLRIELRVGSRARYRPDVDQKVDRGLLKQCQELRGCAGRMTNRVNRVAQSLLRRADAAALRLELVRDRAARSSGRRARRASRRIALMEATKLRKDGVEVEGQCRKPLGRDAVP